MANFDKLTGKFNVYMSGEYYKIYVFDTNEWKGLSLGFLTKDDLIEIRNIIDDAIKNENKAN